MTGTVRLSTAQALVRWLVAQRSELLDGTEVPLFAGVFGIFGHGNVLGLGTALYDVRDQLPTWRAQTEQGMALAATGFAKATDRRQVMVATSSIGPGALNMVTAAGVAHANRLPLLLLPGDTFAGRAPDPVLQQVENFGDATVSVNDAFRPVSRYFDRITRPEQLLASLPQVARVLTDPADCGPVVLALPQDVQVEEFDFPVAMFNPRLHRVPRPRPDARDLASAAEILRASRRPLIVSGGGVRYSGAAGQLLDFAVAHGVAMTETAAGRTMLPDPHPLNAGPLGTIGSASANALAADADVIIAVGTRLQDFTTSSWSLFSPGVRLVTINAARFDAVKHGGCAVVGDARETLAELGDSLSGWAADADWTARVATERARWDAHIDGLRAGAAPDGSLTYAQVVGVVNDSSGPDDYVLGSSGGIPGELNGGWRAGAATVGASMGDGFGASKSAINSEGSWNIGTYKGYKGVDVGVAPTPVGPTGKRASMFNGLGDSVWVGSKVKPAAVKWVEYAASAACEDIVGGKGIVFPAIDSGVQKATAAFKSKGVDVTAFTTQVKDGTTFLFPITDHAAEITAIMQPAMDAVMAFKAEPSSLTAANDQVNALFK